MSLDVAKQFHEIMEKGDLEHYREYIPDITAHFERTSAKLGNACSAAKVRFVEQQKARQEELNQANLPLLRLIRLLRSAAILFAIVAGSVAFASVFGAVLIWTWVTEYWFPTIFFPLGVSVALFRQSRSTGQQTKANEAKASRADEIDALKARAEIGAQIELQILSSINSTLGPRGLLAFPTTAPTLVELSTSAIAPLASIKVLEEFVASHESSAIGLAGNRGSGKSTLLRRLAANEEQFLSVPITCPVHYEPFDFTKRVLLEVSARLSGGTLTRSFASRTLLDRTPIRGRLVGGSVAMLFGGLIALLGFFTGSLGTYSPLTAIGISVFGLGLTVSLYGAVVNTRGRARQAREFSAPSWLRLARELEKVLRLEREYAESSKNVTKIAALVELSDDDSAKFKERALSHADMVEALRELLTEHAVAPGTLPVLICIDELDKLSSAEFLVEAVNNLKDLFHIPRVHFVVSVSTDALKAFERRGLPSRDAFDSAFDTIVSVERLQLNESLEVVQSRAAGFPPALAAVCHAWSGGLPRDLLRAARGCVELQRKYSSALALVDLARTLLARELSTLYDGLIESEAESLDIPTLWCERNALKKYMEGELGLRELADLSSRTSHHERQNRAVNIRLQVACAVLQEVEGVSRKKTWWDVRTENWETYSDKMERLAQAVASAGSAELLREEALAAALGRAH